MLCNCQQEVAVRMLERFKKNKPELTDHHLRLDGYVLTVMDDTWVSIGAMPVVCTGKFLTKKLVEKTSKTTAQMLFSYCPFCGTRYSEPKPNPVKLAQ